jgi:hypothetical protein
VPEELFSEAKVVISRSRNGLHIERLESSVRVATSHMRPDVEKCWEVDSDKLLADFNSSFELKV